MKLTVTIECGVNDFATLAAMLQLAGSNGNQLAIATKENVNYLDGTHNREHMPTPAAAPVTRAPAMPQPAAPAPVAVSAPSEFDASGMPWDERIHSGAKSLNADGTWRKRKGVDAAVIEFVENELRALGATRAAPAPAAVSAPSAAVPMPVAPPMPPPAAPVTPPMPPSEPVAVSTPSAAVPMPPAMPVDAPAPAAPVTPPMPVDVPIMPATPPMPPIEPVAVAAPAAPVMPQPVGPVTFFDLMSAISVLLKANRLTVNDIATICAELTQRLGKSVNALTDVMNDPNGVIATVDILRGRGLWS